MLHFLWFGYDKCLQIMVWILTDINCCMSNEKKTLLLYYKTKENGTGPGLSKYLMHV